MKKLEMKKLMMGSVGLFLIFSFFLGTSQAASKEFVVGCNFVLSGPGAGGGIALQRAVEHATEVINKEGFIVQGEKYVVKPVYYDNKYVPAESVLNLEKMLGQGIKFIYSLGSGCTVPLVEKTTAAKVFMMASCSGSHHLTSPKYPYTFRIYPCNEAAFAVYPWLVKEYPQVKNVAHVNPSDEAGFTESETRVKCAKNVELKNVAIEFFKRGATDYYPVATRIVATKPDLIDFGATAGRDQGLLTKALRELGYKGMITVHYASPKEFSSIAGVENAEGVLFPNSVAEPQTPGQKEIYAWHVKKYGPDINGMLYDNADPLFMLVEAVKKTGSFDPVKVAETFRNLRWNSIFGPMYMGMETLYGIKSSACRPIPTGVFKGGKLQHLATIPWPSDETIQKLNAN
jgi:branched-chain amino acid transport system substrate-binding protein